MNKKAITNGKIITNGSVFSGKNIIVLDGKISAVTNDIPKDCQIIDAKGDYISAGFIDIHTHGAGGYDFNDGKNGDINKALDTYIKNGTTSILPTIAATSLENTISILDHIKSELSSNKKARAIIRGVHLEGPYFAPSMKGAIDARYIKKPEKAEYTYLLDRYKGFIKRWSYAPELDEDFEFLSALKAADVIPSAGHTEAYFPQMEAAAKKGCTLITHLYSCTSTITRKNGYRNLGVIEAAYSLDDIQAELIADGKHIPPQLLLMTLKIMGKDRICLCTDSMRAAGTDSKNSVLGSANDGVPCIIEDGVAKLPDKSAFAGSVATAPDIINFCTKVAKIKLTDAVKMFTENPAKYVVLPSKGDISCNKHADFIIFDEGINIKEAFVAGEKIY